MTGSRSNDVEDDISGSQPASSIDPLFRRITRERFNALGLWGFAQDFRNTRAPASWWAADEERLLALVHTGSKKGDVRVTLLVRDGNLRYRSIRHSPALPTVRYAEEAICGALGKAALRSKFEHHGLEPAAGIDLFAPVASPSRIAPEFRYLRDSFTQSPARELLRVLQPWIVDLDGNLVKDFQTAGYSARVWEIYLRFTFAEMNLAIASDHDLPDFELVQGDRRVFVEATTVDASRGERGAGLRRGAPPPRPDDIMHHLEEVIPLRFGSLLHSNMKKRYWEMGHVRGCPFVLAIADFHDAASMTWSHSALPIYLYGRSAEIVLSPTGRRVAVEKILRGFRWKAETLKPFFEQPGKEKVSAILFSNAGTVSKFNRIGVRAGFGDRYVTLRR